MMRNFLTGLSFFILGISSLYPQEISIDVSPSGQRQVIDGFGTCLAGDNGTLNWFQQLYFDDAEFSIVRMDLVPRFASPYKDNTYNSPWFHNNPSLPGPDNNNVRTYTEAADYTRLYHNRRAQIAVSGPDINVNKLNFDWNDANVRGIGAMVQAGKQRIDRLGDLKIFGSIWSPAPWLKSSSGNTYNSPYSFPFPYTGTPYPFIWYNNFVGGKLDVSDTARYLFFDGVENTSALTQFARITASYVKGIQDLHNFKFYAISIQNELNFETFYNSCTYPLSSQYIKALKAVRKEFDKYADLKDIRLIGPEDLLGHGPYALWQYGSGGTTIHKNLQYIKNIESDPEASAALDFYCLHGYASDGVSSAGSNSTQWAQWADGWSISPAPGIPSIVKGFRFFNKKSWMTETSGENPSWIYPLTGFPNSGGFSIALKIHQALTTGYESAWLYWQMSSKNEAVDGEHLTDATLKEKSPKYVALKHFSKFIRPNAKRVTVNVSGVSNVEVSAYLHNANKSLTVVIINSNSTPQEVTVNIPSIPFEIHSFDAYTSSDNNYWQNSTFNVIANQISLTIPGYGVTTLYGKDVVLPVVLLDFKAVNENNIHKLYWTTASEDNTSHFQVERSIDGVTFVPIGLVTAYGNSNDILHYNFDVKDLLQNEYVYYRLKVVDQNGEFQYSDLVVLNLPFNQDMIVYPQPMFDDQLFVEFKSNLEQQVSLVLTDISGKNLLQSSVYVKKGLNKVELNTQSIPSGFYLLKVETGDRVLLKKVVKN